MWSLQATSEPADTLHKPEGRSNRVMRVKRFVALLMAVALAHRFAGWPTLWLAERTAQALYPGCFLPLATLLLPAIPVSYLSCIMPQSAILLGAYFALVFVTWGALL